MEPYSIIIPKCCSHIYLRGLLKSIEDFLPVPDEIIVVDNKYTYSKYNSNHPGAVNKAIPFTKNELVLIVEVDTLAASKDIFGLLLKEMEDPKVGVASPEVGYEKVGEKLPYCYGTLALVRKSLLMMSPGYKSAGVPSYPFVKWLLSNGYKIAHVKNMEGKYFHLHGSSKMHEHIYLMAYLKHKFTGWKTQYKSPLDFDIYYEDIGTDKVELDDLNTTILNNLITTMDQNKPFSLLRLGDLSLRLLDSHYSNPTDFEKVITHNDLGIQNTKVAHELTEELIRHLKNASWVDHPKLYKGAMNDLYGWRGTLNRIDDIYSKVGINDPLKNNGKPAFCSSLQGHMSLLEDFENHLYRALKGRRVMFIAPWDELGALNHRRNLGLAKYQFYPLSMSNNLEERYTVFQKFFNSFDVKEWDLILTMGSIWGRLIIGRVAELGGRGFDIGQALKFNPCNIFSPTVKPTTNDTLYSLIDHFPKDKILFDSYKDYHKIHRFSDGKWNVLL